MRRRPGSWLRRVTQSKASLFLITVATLYISATAVLMITGKTQDDEAWWVASGDNAAGQVSGHGWVRTSTGTIEITRHHATTAQPNVTLPRHYPMRYKFQAKTRDAAEESGVCESEARFRLLVPPELTTAVRHTCRELQRRQREYYSPKPAKVNPFRYSFLIQGGGICDPDTEVIVLIHSIHDHADRRAAIRQTWGEAVQHNTWPRASIAHKVKVAFVFGLHPKSHFQLDEELKKESFENRDVIQGNFYEHYHNMTLKSLLGLKWVMTFCAHVKYVIKSDDDMFINFPALLDTISQHNMSRAIMGPYNQGSKALRSGKWKLSVSEYPFAIFPPYESGSCYVISSDLVRDLFETSEYVPHIFIDDVYITGILAKIVGAKHLYVRGFAYAVNKRPKPCDTVKKSFLTGTKVLAPQQLDLWRNLKSRLTCPV